MRAMQSRFTFNILAYSAGAVAQVIMTPLTMLIVTGVLAPGEYGKYTLFLAAASFASVLGSQWLQQAISRYVPGQREDREKRKLIGAVLIGVPIVLSFVVLICIGIWSWSGPLKLAVVQQYRWAFVASSCAMSVWACVLSIEQAQFHALRYNIIKVGTAGLILAIFITCLVIGKSGLSAIIAGQTLAYVLACVLCAKGVGFVHSALGAGRERFEMVLGFAGYGMPITIWFLFYTVLTLCDRFFIERYQGEYFVGIYAANATIALGIVSLIATPLIMTLHPLLMKAWDAGNCDVVNVLINEAVNWLLMTLVLGVAFVEITKDFWLKRVMNRAYLEGGGAISTLMAAGVLWQVGTYCHKVLEFRKKTAAMASILGFCVGVSMLFDWLFVGSYGYLAAAFGMVLGNLLYVLFTTALGERIEKGVRIRLNVKKLFIISLAASVAIMLRSDLLISGLILLGILFLYARWSFEKVLIFRSVGGAI